MSLTVPPPLMAQIKTYVDHRCPPAGFLYALLTNNLYAACLKADDTNREFFFDIVAFVEGNLPMACRGSAEAVNDWLAGKEA